MASSLYRTSVFVLYQFSIVLGIALLPVALVTNSAGISLPMGRFIERLGEAYERAESAA
jgi:hypothetical protein